MKDISFLRQLLSIIGSLLDKKEFNYSSRLVHNWAIMIHYLAEMSSIIAWLLSYSERQATIDTSNPRIGSTLMLRRFTKNIFASECEETYSRNVPWKYDLEATKEKNQTPHPRKQHFQVIWTFKKFVLKLRYQNHGIFLFLWF